jgi:hypothetical protein
MAIDLIEGAGLMKLAIAVLVNVILSVGAMCVLFIAGVNFWIAFALFLSAFIPAANFIVSRVMGVDVKERIFQ